jgi:hypothetical protein
MRRLIVRTALLLGLVGACGWARAQPLPPPHVLPPGVQAPLPPPVYYRPSAYQVWQFYDRNFMGQFRPLVIDTPNSPYGAYYRYRGIPFPFMRNYPGEYMPYARGD